VQGDVGHEGHVGEVVWAERVGGVGAEGEEAVGENGVEEEVFLVEDCFGFVVDEAVSEGEGGIEWGGRRVTGGFRSLERASGAEGVGGDEDEFVYGGAEFRGKGEEVAGIVGGGHDQRLDCSLGFNCSLRSNRRLRLDRSPGLEEV